MIKIHDMSRIGFPAISTGHRFKINNQFSHTYFKRLDIFLLTLLTFVFTTIFTSCVSNKIFELYFSFCF